MITAQPLADMTRIADRLETRAAAIEHRLATLLAGAGEAAPRLWAAMRHAALDAGKRFRPFLVIETAEMFGAGERALDAACAIELIHCFSLVHDDLPAMDDDDLRRGRPTVHVAYDEATAILAGDALQSLAFAVLAGDDALPVDQRLALVALLSRATGAAGMAGGQMLDVEGGDGLARTDAVRAMHALKTGALIEAAVAMGAVIGHADAASHAALSIFAHEAGAAFQLADDILDVTASTAALGKTAGKDIAQDKPTLVARLGLAAAREELDARVGACEQALMAFGPEADMLRAAARFIAARQN